MQVRCVDAFGEMPVEGPVPSPPAGRSWEELMGLALEQAARAEACGEVPVGAVVADPSGRILAACANAPVRLSDPTAHAEVLALRAAAAAAGNYRLTDCVLVVTLEPCAMCAAAMVHARLAGVVFGARDALAGCVVSRTDLLDYPFFNHAVWHMGGVRSAECAAMLRRFFAGRR